MVSEPQAVDAGTQQAYVCIEHVSKRFDDFLAVDDVSIDVRQGEIFCLLGGSGSGKTTLLRMLAGFEIPSSGRILVDGRDMSTVPPYQRPVNMMFQSYALFPHMSVEKNIAFGLEQEGLGRGEIRRRVGEMLDMVKMAGFGPRKPQQLSGGQRQRVALARSLVKRPKLLLLDEPLAALDRKLREHTQFELINIQKALGVTFIVVTHDQQEAMTLATRMGVMNQGRIVQVGTPSQIYESPDTRFIADFIGSANLFAGRVLEHHRIRCDELGCVIKVDRPLPAAGDATVWAAVRPEQIVMTRQPPAGLAQLDADAENATRAVVRDIAYRGDASVYRVALASGREVRVTLPNSARAAAQRISRDEVVFLSWDAGSPVVLTE